MQINFLTQISGIKHSQTYDFKIEIKKGMRLDGPSLSLKSTAIFSIYLYKQGLKAVQESEIAKNSVVFLHVCNKTAIYR